MKSFLDKISSSEKLKRELSSSDLSVFHDLKTDKVRIMISNGQYLSANLNIELLSKTISKFNEINIELNFINFEIDPRNDLVNTYENLIAYLEFMESEIDRSSFIINFENNSLNVLVTDDGILKQFTEISNSLQSFLGHFSICSYGIKIKKRPEALGTRKLNQELEKGMIYETKRNTIIDEKIREKHNEIDFKISGSQKNIYFQGFVFDLEKRKASTGTTIYSFSLGKEATAIMVTVFDKQNVGTTINDGDAIRVYGMYEFDDYNKTNILKSFSPNNIQNITYSTLNKIKADKTDFRRNEFHVHTKMSTLDGISNIQEYIKHAEAYSLDSITLTDHNSLQSFPDASAIMKKTDVKINFGIEFDIYNDINTKIVINEKKHNLIDAEYVFFDLETTSISAFLNEIIEFGAVKYKDNKIIDRKQLFIKPKKEISEFITSLTSITNDDLVDAPTIDEVIVEIKDWIGDAILVAHNASFDYNFLNKAYNDNGLGDLKNPVIDTMKLSWLIHPKARSHRLSSLAKREFIKYDDASGHRADYDAEILSKIYERLLHKIISTLKIRDLRSLNKESKKLSDYFFAKHITLISKNQRGLRDLNKLVSIASIKYFNKRKKNPTLPLSILFRNFEGLFDNLLVGSACDNGFIFQSILENDWNFIESIIDKFDYLEVFPPSTYKHLVVSGAITPEDIEKVIREIVKLGEKYNIPVIASSNAHYASKTQKRFRDILITSQRVGGSFHPRYNFKNPIGEKSDVHLRTTPEMLDIFSKFLPDTDVMDIVINNPSKLQNLIEIDQDPIKKKLYPPKIIGVETKIKELIKINVSRLYGDLPDKIITDRIAKELESIFGHGFGIIYYLSSIAVKKSLDDGFLVGSRGSVGSSIVATLTDITEVNPLPPHYRCEKCKYHKFSDLADTGYDLPKLNCPNCIIELTGEGHNIPFETFLGFNGDKVPDIDLNFSRENQSSVHQHMKTFLGEENIYRAGTISTAAQKTALGYVKNFEEVNNENLNKATVNWMANNIMGAKRTTGQHPGGLIVIPDDMEVYDFTAINYPGDDFHASWKTTHFDFHSIHDNLLKLDLLGHLDPSMIRMLENLTNVGPKTIPMNDKEVISLFLNNKSLKINENLLGEKLGIIGLPEFGTKFVRELVREAKPKSFADLVRISGLSHGTDVWSNNAQKLIRNKEAVLSEVISVRDDILGYLMKKGIENSIAFNIMESVRKGKGLTQEWITIMRENSVPDWYIESCKLIKYMFPKAHATAYVMMAFRIAWYKINYPLEYYAAYFSKRDVEIEIEIVLKGVSDMKKHISEIKDKPRYERNKKDDDLLETYNIILEMYSRGIKFTNLDVKKSRSKNYSVDIENDSIIPPFSVLEGVGILVAEKLTIRRREKEFTLLNDFKKRSGLPKKVIKKLMDMGVFDDFDDGEDITKQLSLFS